MTVFTRLARCLVLMAGLAAWSVSAHAACTSPASEAGTIKYASNINSFVFCNGTDWVSMAGWNNSSGGGAGLLNELADVDTSGATIGSTLSFNGSSWVVSDSAPASSAPGDRITSGTLAMVANSATSYISLSTGGTDWGYLSSAASYLPTISAGKVSSTNVSATHLQLSSPTTVLACGTGLEGAMRYTSGTMQVCDGNAWGNIGIGVPTGTIAAFAASSCPSGWTEYTPARGRFLRGIDNGAGNDPDGTRVAGHSQADAMQQITGGVPNLWASSVDNATGAFANSNGNSTRPAGGTQGAINFSFDSANSPGARTANETRPKNVAVTFCVYSGFQSAPGQTILTTLASLTDVSIAGATTGQALIFDGASWIASDTAGGGSANAAGSAGAVQFNAGGTTFGADTNNFFWDDTNKRLGVGVGTPLAKLDVAGTISASNAIQVGSSSISCVAGTAGSIRYTSGALELCNGSSWSALGGGSQFRGALVKKSASQSISAGNNVVIAFDAEEYDVGDWHDNSINNTRLTVPEGVSRVRLSVQYTNTNLTGQTLIEILKNGTDFVGKAMSETDTAGVDSVNATTAVVEVSPGDYFEARVFLTNNETLTSSQNVWFGIEEVSGVGSGGGASELSGLSDVDTSGAVTGNILSYNGSSWVVSSTGTGEGLGDRITSGTLAIVANSESSIVSLSTNGTVWGYLGSAASYLPTLVGTRVSSTNVSATTVHVSGNVGIGTADPSTTLYVNGGQIAGGFGAMSTGGVLDFNDVSNARSGNGYTLLRGSTASNGPNTTTNYWQTLNFEYGASKLGDGNVTQLAIPYSSSASIGDGMYMRGRYSAVWTGWYKFIMSDPSGNAVVANNMTAAAFLYSSDKRLKENIIPLTGGLAKLEAITPVTFSFISDTTHTTRLGVIAQEVEKVYPQAVITGSDGYKKVDYPALVPVLIDAVKELKADNDNLRRDVDAYREMQRASMVDTVGLKEKVEALEAANDNFQRRLEALEARKASMK